MNPAKQTSAPTSIDLTNLSDEALASLAVEVPREIAQRKSKAEQEFFEETRARMAVLGISWDRLRKRVPGGTTSGKRVTSHEDKRSAVRPKYRDPKTGSTWSGRGGAPKWLSDHIAAGGSKDELRIPDPDTKA